MIRAYTGFGAIDVGARRVPSWQQECGRLKVSFTNATTVGRLRCYAARFYEGNLAYAQSSAEPALSRHINAANIYSSSYYIPNDNPSNSAEQNVAAMRISIARADRVSVEALSMPGSRDPDYVASEAVLQETSTKESLPIPAQAYEIPPVKLPNGSTVSFKPVAPPPAEVKVDQKGRETVIVPKEAAMTTGAKVGIAIAAAVAIGGAVLMARRGRRGKRRRR